MSVEKADIAKKMMAMKEISMMRANMKHLDMVDGKDGKISGSIWNEHNPNNKIDENGFKDLEEAIKDKEKEILKQYGYEEKDLEEWKKADKNDTLKKLDTGKGIKEASKKLSDLLEKHKQQKNTENN